MKVTIRIKDYEDYQYHLSSNQSLFVVNQNISSRLFAKFNWIQKVLAKFAEFFRVLRLVRIDILRCVEDIEKENDFE